MEGDDKLELNVLAGQLMAIKEGLGMCPSPNIECASINQFDLFQV